MTRISTTPKESSRCLFGFVCVCVYDSIPRPRPLGSEKAPRLQAGHMPILSSGAPLALSSSLRRWYQLVSSCPLDYHGFLENSMFTGHSCVCVRMSAEVDGFLFSSSQELQWKSCKSQEFVLKFSEKPQGRLSLMPRGGNTSLGRSFTSYT